MLLSRQPLPPLFTIELISVFSMPLRHTPLRHIAAIALLMMLLDACRATLPEKMSRHADAAYASCCRCCRHQRRYDMPPAGCRFISREMLSLAILRRYMMLLIADMPLFHLLRCRCLMSFLSPATMLAATRDMLMILRAYAVICLFIESLRFLSADTLYCRHLLGCRLLIDALSHAYALPPLLLRC